MNESYHIDKEIGMKEEPEDLDSFLSDRGASFRIKYEDDYEKKYQLDQCSNDTMFESVSVETSATVVVEGDISGCSAFQGRIKKERPDVKAEEQTPRLYIDLSSFKIIDVNKLIHEDWEREDLQDKLSLTSKEESQRPETTSEDEENIGRETESESKKPSPPRKHHMRVGDEEAELEPSDGKRWPCSSVPKSKFRKVHCEAKTFTCRFCAVSFTCKRNMDRHFLRLHEKKRKTRNSPSSTLVCRCGKAFPSSWELKRHFLIHTEGKPYSCQECDRKFASKGYLNKHLVTHGGGKPFCCDDCGKHFKEKGSLKCHIATHSGIKPFACLSCNYSFYRKKDLNRHAMTHSKRKPFSCSPCRKSFTRRCQLWTHIMGHHPDSIGLKESLKRTSKSK